MYSSELSGFSNEQNQVPSLQGLKIIPNVCAVCWKRIRNSLNGLMLLKKTLLNYFLSSFSFILVVIFFHIISWLERNKPKKKRKISDTSGYSYHLFLLQIMRCNPNQLLPHTFLTKEAPLVKRTVFGRMSLTRSPPCTALGQPSFLPARLHLSSLGFLVICRLTALVYTFPPYVV